MQLEGGLNLPKHISDTSNYQIYYLPCDNLVNSLYASQKHLGSKKVQGQEEPAP